MKLKDVLRAVDEQVVLNAVRTRHLRFLDDLVGAPHDDLGAYFPETAAGTLRPQRGESLYETSGIRYIGRDDGTMVPVDADHLEPMPENEWHADKFSALVEAVEAQQQPIVEPGYADLEVEDGALTAQVRDGNHRTFAPIAAGGDSSWVMMSDRTRQDLDERERGSEALYRAVRAAQRQAGAPQFKRRQVSRVQSGQYVALLEAERQMHELDRQQDDVYRELLRTHGPARQPFDLREQLERPQLFWRMRAGELTSEAFDEVFDSELGQRLETVTAQRDALFDRLYDLRKEAGLKHGERLDPATGKVVR